MKHSIKTGFSFGLTSGVITTLGLMIGLHSGTHSRIVVIGGILTIAIADSLSDALGIHISEESENRHSAREIWESTIATIVSKLVVALTFIVPLILLSLSCAIVVSTLWGLLLLGIFSFAMARAQSERVLRVVLEHVGIAVLVIAVTHYVGHWVSTFG